MTHRGRTERRNFLSPTSFLVNYKLLNNTETYSQNHHTAASLEEVPPDEALVTGFPCVMYHCTKSCADKCDTCILRPDSGTDYLVSHSATPYLQVAGWISTNNWNIFCFKIKSSLLPVKSLRFAVLLTQQSNIFFSASRHKTIFWRPWIWVGTKIINKSLKENLRSDKREGFHNIYSNLGIQTWQKSCSFS